MQTQPLTPAPQIPLFPAAQPPRSMGGVRFDELPPSFKATRPELAGHGVEFKALSGEIKADRTQRRVDLWIAGYGNVDSGGDLMVKGFGARSIAEDLPRGLVKFFWNHQLPLGPADVLEEHDQGLFMSSKVTADVAFDRYLAQIDDGTAGHGSLGYSVRASETVTAEEVQKRYGVDAGGASKVRVLLAGRIFEGSAVIWPMNELVEVVGIKGAEQKGLWELADVIASLATIRMLTEAEWAKLTEEEATEARALLDKLTMTEKSIRDGLAARESKDGPPPGGFDTLIAAARERRKSIENYRPAEG